MTTNQQDARALTYLAKRLREETHGANTWDEHGIHAVVTKLVGQNLAITIERVTRHAQDPEAKTPGAIGRPFIPAAPERRTDMPPTKRDECRTHPGEFAHNCRACISEAKGGDGYGHDEQPAPVPAGGWDPARIRESIRRLESRP